MASYFENVKDKIDLSELVEKHLQEREIFKATGDEKVFLVSGKQQRPSRTRLVTVNVLAALKDTETGSTEGVLNINIQDHDTLWIEYIGEYIQLIMDESIVSNYRLTYNNEHLFKVADGLYFKNLKFNFSKI
ncbi:hypothetical protein [Sphingobacterium deserti]|uniref:Uncharacterized protein n=1 Tax=Sphingobacterium deserti TaxID=1229276 RepID=A0A0B8T159_9SPHI|nr:hypothetical protein [Sphingobacterium deserti]KGE14567.1 hypothetical protein DI53_1596 [Sphingobacterium deserti]